MWKMGTLCEEKVNDVLKRLEKLEIVSKLLVNSVMDWPSSLAVAVKPNRKIKLCTDCKPLKKVLKEIQHQQWMMFC